MSDSQFSAGDVLIDRGQVFKVVKIKSKKNLQNEQEDYLVLKPYFDTPRTSTLMKNMPVSAIEEPSQRRPITKKELSSILKSLKTMEREKLEAMAVKEDIKDASFEEAATLAKQLWMEDQDEDSKLSFTKRQAYKRAIRQLSQEIAVIKDVEFEKAEQFFLKALAA